MTLQGHPKLMIFASPDKQ